MKITSFRDLAHIRHLGPWVQARRAPGCRMLRDIFFETGQKLFIHQALSQRYGHSSTVRLRFGSAFCIWHTRSWFKSFECLNKEVRSYALDLSVYNRLLTIATEVCAVRTLVKVLD